MSKIKSEIDCLERLHDLTASLDSILAFLLEEKVITADDVKACRSSSFFPRSVAGLIQLLQKNGNLQLVEYEWHILPVERIKLLIVTDRSTREFSFNF